MGTNCEVCGKIIGESFDIPKLCCKCLHRAYRIGVHILRIDLELKNE